MSNVGTYLSLVPQVPNSTVGLDAEAHAAFGKNADFKLKDYDATWIPLSKGACPGINEEAVDALGKTGHTLLAHLVALRMTCLSRPSNEKGEYAPLSDSSNDFLEQLGDATDGKCSADELALCEKAVSEYLENNIH